LEQRAEEWLEFFAVFSLGLRISAVQKLNIKLEQQHVAVFHDVFLAFHAIQTFFTRGFGFKSVL